MIVKSFIWWWKVFFKSDQHRLLLAEKSFDSIASGTSSRQTKTFLFRSPCQAAPAKKPWKDEILRSRPLTFCCITTNPCFIPTLKICVIPSTFALVKWWREASWSVGSKHRGIAKRSTRPFSQNLDVLSSAGNCERAKKEINILAHKTTLFSIPLPFHLNRTVFTFSTSSKMKS